MAIPPPLTAKRYNGWCRQPTTSLRLSSLLSRTSISGGVRGRALKLPKNPATQTIDCSLCYHLTNGTRVYLSQSAVPTCFRMSTIVPVLKKAKVTELNYYRLVALTSVIMKCSERLVKDHITNTHTVPLDQHQFSYRPKRSTDDAIANTLHTALY